MFQKLLKNDKDLTNFITSSTSINVLLSLFANSSNDKNINHELYDVLHWSNDKIGTSMNYKVFYNQEHKFWMDDNHVFLPNIRKYDYYFYRILNHVTCRLITVFNKKFEICCSSNPVHCEEITMKILKSLLNLSKFFFNDYHKLLRFAIILCFFSILAEKDLTHPIVATISNIEYMLSSCFYEEDTRLMPFRTNKNYNIMVDTMYQLCETPVYVDGDFTAINLQCTVTDFFIIHLQ